MKIKFTLAGVMMAVCLTPSLLIASDEIAERDPHAITFISNIKRLPDASYQEQLKNSPSWQQFLSNHGTWKSIFNEENGRPQRAYGKPVNTTFSGNPKEIADAFLAGDLAAFNLPYSELRHQSTNANQKYYYVNYKQFHNNLEVLWADVQIKMMKDGRVMLFSVDVRDNIQLNITPSLNEVAAGVASTAGITYVVNQVTVKPELKILPVPAFRSYEYHLVYEAEVEATNFDGFPATYYTLVDAHNGQVLYRQNTVMNCAYDKSANTDVNVTGTLYATNPYNPSSVEPLKYLKIVVGGTTYYTDDTGYLGLSNTSSTSATLSLEGRWARVRTGTVTPSFTATFNPGVNNVDFTAANIKELSAYHSVQEIHDYYKIISAGSGADFVMDFIMTTIVDVAGTCNAFYNGNINFYAAGGGCNATSLVADVIYHEYGHGINSLTYNTFGGGSMGNGAMNEGYADTWANGLTEDPILGIGFFSNNPTGYVRRYDINKKVYPQDLTGEVHADGEIIAGCWWDVGLNFNDHQARQALFFSTFPAVLDASQGQEGQLYQEVLIEALTNDDDDGDLTNGTPHYCEIVSAFAIHGITLGGAASAINHNEVLTAPPATPIDINATVANLAVGGTVNAYYKINGQGNWTLSTMSNIGGNNYSTTIPSQPNGTIIHYYLDITDDCGTHLGITPNNAQLATNPNIPFYVLVGFNLLNTQDLENAGTSWQLGAPGDNATTGIWIIADPVASYLSGTTGMVQTEDDHTVNPGVKCAVTGNANPGDAAGTQDIDNGKTTLISQTYDLSTYTNPAFTYWRWYSNDQGSTPGTDFWQVAISNDGGNTWTDIENTNVSDHSWRRYAFIVANYVTPTADVKLRFIGEDAGSGSLVEAAVDDVQLWDMIPTSVSEQQNINSFSAFPVPAKDVLSLRWNLQQADELTIMLTDNIGRMVSKQIFSGSTGFNALNIPLNKVESGVYLLSIKGQHTSTIQKISVIH